MPKKSNKSDEQEVCCVCMQAGAEKRHKITENFVKVNAKYLPIREIIRDLNLIHYEAR